MKKTLIVVLVVALGWYGNYHYKQQRQVSTFTDENHQDAQQRGNSTATFQCDGRTYCSQMTSCAEATFFIRNCPNTKMDGNNDGVPCESQWCK